MAAPDSRKARVGGSGPGGSGSAEVKNWHYSDSEHWAPTQGGAFRSVMEQWREQLEFKLALARLKLSAGAPDHSFDRLTSEVEEFAAVAEVALTGGKEVAP